jgi:hypothetical protein
MAYTGATTPNVGTDSAADLKRDVTLDVLEAKERQTRFADLIRTDTLAGGASAGSFIVEGKEDTTNGALATYPTGTQVNVNNGTQDEITIALDRPQYESRRIDKFEQAVARYDTLAMSVRQLGKRLANAIDRKCSAAIEASSLATGLVSNGNGTVVTNTALAGGAAAAATAELLGKELIESIYSAVAAMETNDVVDEVYVGMSPTNFQYLPQALTIVSSDYTSNNGGLDIGDVKMVGGATVFTSNNLPATAGLVALAFTSEAAAMVKLWDIKVDINTQADFLDAKLINAYFSNGVGALRPQCSVSIKNV